MTTPTAAVSMPMKMLQPVRLEISLEMVSVTIFEFLLLSSPALQTGV